MHSSIPENNAIAKSNESPVVMFLHIPKCAGNSLYTMFQQQYGSEHVYIPYKSPAENANFIASLSEEEKENVQAVCAHMPYGAHKYFASSQYVTVLRDPVDRIVSSYYFSLNQKNPPKIGQNIKKLNWTVDHFAHLQGFENMQTRWLDSKTNFENHDFSPTILWNDPHADEVLERAKRVIDECIAVGFVEDFKRSIDLFQEKLGWRSKINISKLMANKNEKRERLDSLDEDTIEKIKDANRLDIELYEYAKKRFDDECNSLGL